MENRIVSNVLERNTDFISRHLVLSPTVLEKLKENGLISESTKRQIAFKDTDEQVPFLIHSLNDRGLLTLKKFLAVLKETGHSWMVDTLLNTQALSYEEIASSNPRQRSGLLSNRSRLQGMTPEHARMRLTSAGLQGRGTIADRYGGGGLDGFGLGTTGTGLQGGDRVGFRGSDRNGLDLLGLPTPPHWKRSSYMPKENTRLMNLLDARERSAKFRGHIKPALMLEDHTRTQPKGLFNDYTGGNPEDIPGALLNLHDHFQTQSDTNEQTLTVLKREEMAIKELLDQNVREQSKVRRNQNALTDIGRRLEEINIRANEVHDPLVHSQLSKYRLAQLNQIPWSSENRY